MIPHLLHGDTDVHSGNVGFRGNQPLYFDPSNREPGYLASRPEYSTSTPPLGTSEETVDYGENTFVFDEEDETVYEESKADHSNKTFDWEYS